MNDEVERITVTLPVGLTEEIRAAVDVGDYPTADAAVEKAVQNWTDDRIVDRIGLERLRQHWEEGLASGNFRTLDLQDVQRRVDERVAAIQAASQRVD